MGRPPKFTRRQVQEAALALVDEHGVDGLSMRRLAGALGTGPMTLYNHVSDRQDLERLVVDAVLGQARPPAARPGDWRAGVEEAAVAMWEAVRAHPHAVPLILTRRSTSTAVHDIAEALLAALAGSGRTGRDLLVAFRAVTAFVTGSIQVELAGPLATAADERAADVIARMSALPGDRYPHLVDIAHAAAGSDAAAEFREGLRCLLAGLDATANG